jgi:hypothetical protein
MLLFLGLGAIAHVVWMGGDWEEDELRKHKWVREIISLTVFQGTEAQLSRLRKPAHKVGMKGRRRGIKEYLEYAFFSPLVLFS